MFVGKQQWILWAQWTMCHCLLFIYIPIFSITIPFFALFVLLQFLDVLHVGGSPFLIAHVLIAGLGGAVATTAGISAMQLFFVWHRFLSEKVWVKQSAIAGGSGSLVGMVIWFAWWEPHSTQGGESSAAWVLYMWASGGVGALVLMAIGQSLLLHRQGSQALWWLCSSLLGVALSTIVGSSLFWLPDDWSITPLFLGYGAGYGLLTGSIITRLAVRETCVPNTFDTI